MKKAGIILFLLLGSLKMFGQITLQMSDLAGPGDVIIDASQFYSGTTPPTGANQTYPFPESDTTILDTTFFVATSSTPFADTMTNSNLAVGVGNSYTYYNLNNSGFYLRGFVFDFTDFPLDLPFSFAPFRFNPPLSLLTFPATNGMNLKTTGTARFEFPYDTIITIFGAPARVTKAAVIATARDTSVIDGYGNAEFVSGLVPCLRNSQNLKMTFKIQVFAKISIFPASWVDLPANLLPGGGLPELYTKSLLFWANGKKSPIATLEIDSMGNVASASYKRDLLVTSQNPLVSAKPSFRFEAAPNPAGDIISFSSEEILKKIRIFSLTGQKILEQNLETNQKGISLSALASGTYVAELESGKGFLSRKKLIISR
jgi:hypothetical protein